MKKILSLILAVMMLLGCMSLTAFAETDYKLKINGVAVTTEGAVTGNAAITAGTVTYTAAEHNNGTAKLTLNNATIVVGDHLTGIHALGNDLVIELIGENTIQADQADDAPAINILGNGTFIGNGSLTASSKSFVMYFQGLCTFSMRGTLKATTTYQYCLDADDGYVVSEGAGKVIVHGAGDKGSIVSWENGTLTGYKTFVGSADAAEENEANMSPAAFDSFEYDAGEFMTLSKVGDSVAKTVVLTSNPAPATSGTTDITAVKAEPFSYEIVFPTTVPTITAAGVTEIGAPSVEEVKNATEKTVISYTATGTQLTLEGDSKTMTTSYYTDSEGKTAMPSTAIRVYKNKALVNPLTKLYVGVAEDDWNAADAGTYHATVTFNFTAEEKEVSLTGTPLFFTAVEAGATVKMAKTGTPAAITLQTSTDGESWTDYTYDDTITLANVGDEVYFRTKEENTSAYYTGNTKNYHFVTGEKKIAASGNIMSLISPEDFASETELPADNCFHGLFSGCASLTEAPALPATTLTESCYESMFRDCTSLTTAPALPATVMKGCCYGSMFDGCANLTTAPALNAMELADWCYSAMFCGCEKLTPAPALPATTLTEGCYQCMFEDCKNLQTAPTLTATEMKAYCYEYMFSGCSSLQAAPALPAETLAEACYEDMFENCTNLTVAPVLPAETMAEDCYNSMFKGCTNLITAPVLPAETLAESCYEHIFSGCTSLDSVTMLATDITADSCLYYWLSDTASTGNLYVDGNMTGTLTAGSNYIPAGWTVHGYNN